MGGFSFAEKIMHAPVREMAELPTFDLSRIIDRVRKEHREWPEERIQRAEADYRRFLACGKANP
jgi:hypothetical protein